MIRFLLLLLLVVNGCAYRAEILDLPKHQPKLKRNIENPRVALVLGGGGAKGYVHLGVIETLKKHGIPIDLIVGTSAGSIVGGLYASDPDVAKLKATLFNATTKDFINIGVFSLIYGVSDGSAMRSFLDKHLAKKNIEDFPIPFVAVATSLETAQSFVFDAGPVVPAINASAALPSLFLPVYVYGQHLVDGGATEPVPVKTARKYSPKIVISVNIASRPKTTADYSKVSIMQGYNSVGLAHFSLAISYYELAKMQAEQADVAISPDLSKYGILDDQYREEMYLIGKKAAEKSIDRIKSLLDK